MAKFKSVIQETKGETIFLRGKAQWAHVVEADQYGNFSINVYPDAETLEKFTTKLNSIRDAAAKEVETAGKEIKDLGATYKTDNDGKKYIQAKLPLEGYDDADNEIEFFDISGNKLTDFTKLIGNGSEVVIRLYAKPYYMNSTKQVGISNKFYAVQIINLVEFVSGGADGGFASQVVEKEISTETFPDIQDIKTEDIPF